MACVVTRRGDRARGCGRAEGVLQTPRVLTLPPPTPAGMQELPPELVPAPGGHRRRMRPHRKPAPVPQRSPGRRRRREHQDPRQAHRRARHRQQPVQLPRPDDRRDHRVRRRHRGRGGTRLFGTPSLVEYRILVVCRSGTALQNNQVDIVVKTMSITCGAQEAGQLLDASTSKPTSGSWHRATRRSPRQATCPGSGSARSRARRRCSRSSRSTLRPIVIRSSRGPTALSHCSSDRSTRSAPTTRSWPGSWSRTRIHPSGRA